MKLDIPAKEPLKGPWILHAPKAFALELSQVKGVGRFRPAVFAPDTWRIYPSELYDPGEVLFELFVLVEDETSRLMSGVERSVH